MTEIVVELPRRLRPELKEPVGVLHTETPALLAAAGDPLVTVGDVVTHHVIDAGTTPDVALVDDQTERSAVDETIASTINEFAGFDHEVTVPNPAATLTAELLSALVTAVERAGTESTLVVVDGEEDLAALPAIALVPDSASVVYGQPGEGMILVTVDSEIRAEITDLLARMDGETERLQAMLD